MPLAPAKLVPCLKSSSAKGYARLTSNLLTPTSSSVRKTRDYNKFLPLGQSLSTKPSGLPDIDGLEKTVDNLGLAGPKPVQFGRSRTSFPQ